MDATACGHASETRPTDVSAYSDIAGIGIILSFTITTLIIVCLLLGYYILAFDPELDPFRSEGEKSKICQFPNPIDGVVLALVRSIPDIVKLPSFSIVKTEELDLALNSCVLTFLDTQVFTGTAALFCTLRELKHGLQVYHLEIVAKLGWLAFLTALSALSFLRNHFVNYPAQRFWRLAMISIMFGLLSFTVGLTGYFEIRPFNDNSTADDAPIKPWEPAIRFLGQKMPVNTLSFDTMFMMLLIMVWGFSIRLAKMSVIFDHELREYAFRLRRQSERRQLGDGHTCNWDPRLCHTVGECVKVRLADPFIFAFFRVLHVHLDLFTSFLSEVFWVSVCTAWGILRLFQFRINWGPSEENKWQFGQIVPLILLVAPFPRLIDHWSSKKKLFQIIRRAVSKNPSYLGQPRYELFISFLGSLAIVAASYVGAAVYLIQQTHAGVLDSLRGVVLPFFIYGILVPMMWIAHVVWLFQLKLPLWSANSALTITFLVFISLPFAGYKGGMSLDEFDDLPENLESILAFGTILSTYLLYIGWFALSLQVEATKRYRKAVYHGLRIIFCLLAIIMPWVFHPSSIIWHLKDRDAKSWAQSLRRSYTTAVPAVTGLQFLWLVIEWIMKKRQMKIRTKYFVRTTFVGGIILFFLVEMCFGGSVMLSGTDIIWFSQPPAAVLILLLGFFETRDCDKDDFGLVRF